MLVAGCADDASPPDVSATTSTAAAATSTSSSATTTTATTAATPTTAPTTAPADEQLAVQDVIHLGGTQVLGLAIDATSVWAVSFDDSSITRIDPVSGETETVALPGGAASAIALGSDVWVVAYGPSALVRIDAGSAAVAATYPFDELCCDLTTDGSSLWAVDPGGAVLEVDPATGEVLTEIGVELDRNSHINAVHDGRYLWVSSDTTPLHRIDTAVARPEITDVDVGGGVPFFARDGLVWGASATEVWAVDADGAVVEQHELTRSTEVIALEVTERSVWVGLRHPRRVGAVVQIDRATGAQVSEIGDVDIPARMALGFGSLWVTDSGSDAVVRIGPVG
jgi:streptogramin lyase